MASKMQALVIGIGDYPTPMNLDSPPRDAQSVADRFSELGIEYELVIDATFERAKQAVDVFLARVAEPSTKTSILYYSGHGIQINDTNYIIPVDFKTAQTDKPSLISVQSILDQMINQSAIRIVFMDACRVNLDAREFVGAKGIGREVGKEFVVAGNAVPVPGLAEIKTQSNTFIAFAAAPGDVAYDGAIDGALSPFTASLVKYLDVVDLPLSNLMSRVRLEVETNTRKRQQTWDQSSLMAPFYFNPGNLLLFAGNFMALVGLLISLTIYSMFLAACWVCAPQFYLYAAAALPVFSLAILLYGVQSVYSRLRGRFEGTRPSRSFMARLLTTAVQKGLLGGVLGSLVAAPVLSALYYHGWPFSPISLGQLSLEITYGTAFAACPLGVLSFLFAGLARRNKVGSAKERFWTFAGGCFGGALAGAVSAPFITAFFGLMHNRPPMTPELLLPGSIFGAAFLVVAIVNFDFERLSSRRVWTSVASALMALGVGFVVTAIVFIPLYLLGVASAVQTFLQEHSEQPIELMKGGFIYGLPVGFVLGSVIASAILLTEHFSKKELIG
ncbi:caspase domain-containing protein [Rhizobium ruizarguesonis]